jgi:hypothetical protein
MHKLAGIVACSGWLALGEKLDNVCKKKKKKKKKGPITNSFQLVWFSHE